MHFLAGAERSGSSRSGFLLPFFLLFFGKLVGDAYYIEGSLVWDGVEGRGGRTFCERMMRQGDFWLRALTGAYRGPLPVSSAMQLASRINYRAPGRVRRVAWQRGHDGRDGAMKLQMNSSRTAPTGAHA